LDDLAVHRIEITPVLRVLHESDDASRFVDEQNGKALHKTADAKRGQ
jgi:hypothetical protein